MCSQLIQIQIQRISPVKVTQLLKIYTDAWSMGDRKKKLVKFLPNIVRAHTYGRLVLIHATMCAC